ncbi:MAG: ABC transporter ATP-binding protein [Spirochaetaceae bacterium]|jgi:ABC-type nitrate/sulfonate/bicarbonate transport system ATPase subunit|nr:ABC transporter ATP-binding protein [Spirochaetaceae bacterium]
MMSACNKTQFFCCENICKSYEGRDIIKNISLQLESGGFISIIGPSGVGKTTLFNILSGLDQPDSGGVWLNGEEITGKPGRISYMPQKDLLFEHLSIIDNVTLPLLLSKQNKKEARRLARSFFGQFGLEGCERSFPARLSGGMRQRAALLRACMYNVPVILLDEPFSSLDAITRSRMRNWYEGIAQEMKLSTLCITHDIEEAIKLSERIYVINGRPGIVQKIIAVDAPHPRGGDFLLSAECARLKETLQKALDF